MTLREEGIENTLLRVISDGRKCLVPYITGGFDGYLEAISAAAEAGANAIEIGIPFSDPVMDGPTIQEANDLVLSAGVTPLQIIDEIASLDVDIPLAVMTYYNVVYRFGLERFASYLREASTSAKPCFLNVCLLVPRLLDSYLSGLSPLDLLPPFWVAGLRVVTGWVVGLWVASS